MADTTGRYEWPNGIKCGVALTFDLDAETLWTSRSSDRSPSVLSEGTYGPTVGVPRILDMLDRLGVRATFFVPAQIVELHTGAVRDIVSRGHEIGYHSYDHTASESIEMERATMRRCREIYDRLLGVRPVGYRAPLYDLKAGTIDLAAEEGFLYSSNMHDADSPYLHKTSRGSLIELPCHWVFDDSAHFFFTVQQPARRPIATPGSVMEIWRGEFEGLYDEGGFMALVLHPQIMGRVSRVRMLEELIFHMQSKPGTLVTSGEDLARTILPSLNRGKPGD